MTVYQKIKQTPPEDLPALLPKLFQCLSPVDVDLDAISRVYWGAFLLSTPEEMAAVLNSAPFYACVGIEPGTCAEEHCKSCILCFLKSEIPGMPE